MSSRKTAGRAARRCRAALVLGIAVIVALHAATDERPAHPRSPIDRQSPGRATSGPVPPPNVDPRGRLFTPAERASATVIAEVPAYLWRHGSAQTAAGMVLGYYDRTGFPDLLPGDAAAQTDAVNDALASPEHYEDYSLPLDRPPNLLRDKSELPADQRHANNCLADYLFTSWSLYGNYYGETTESDIGYALPAYVSAVSSYKGIAAYYQAENVGWHIIQNEILSGRPLVFLVDSEGDGGPDLFVAVAGINTVDEVHYYGCYDTWDQDLHWYRYQGPEAAQPWSVHTVYTIVITHVVLPPLDLTLTALVNDFLFYREHINRLTWSGNPANKTRILRYKIYRKESQEPNTAFRLIGEVEAETKRFDDRGLRRGQSYTYRVTSVDEDGRESGPAVVAN